MSQTLTHSGPQNLKMNEYSPSNPMIFLRVKRCSKLAFEMKCVK